jgi:hypothetical protein
MRIIKFRGLRVDGKGWVYGHYYDDEIQSFIIYEINTYEVIPESVGQFTGKLTINHMEIYEGDLIAPCNGGIPKQVVWDEIFCGWYFEIEPFSKLKVLDKIIGNIHEK